MLGTLYKVEFVVEIELTNKVRILLDKATLFQDLDKLSLI